MGMKSSAQPPDPAAQSARVVRLRGRPSPRPSVTVVMPTYNSSRFVLQALESLFAQSRPPDEIVVVDDGSTDDTFDCISPYLPRIIYHREKRRGVAAARNAAIALSSGDLIAFLDADDWYLPDHLSHLTQRLVGHAELGLVECGWRRVNKEGIALADVEPWHWVPRLDMNAWLLWKPVFPGAMMVRREWLQSIGGFDESLDISSDVDLTLRLALAGCQADWVREVSVCYRQHAANWSRDTAKMARSLDKIHTRLFQHPNLPAKTRDMEPSVLRSAAVWLAWHALQSGLAKVAIAQLRLASALENEPTDVLALGWQSDFVRFSRLAGVPPPPRSTTDTVYRRALGVEEHAWAEIEAPLTASAVGWLRNGENATAGLPRSILADKDHAARRLVNLVRPELAPTAEPVPPRTVHHWWGHLTRAGVVPAASRGEVTTLHLHAFVQALQHRRWGDALHALVLAALGVWLPRGGSAWVRFVRAGARRLVLRQ